MTATRRARPAMRRPLARLCLVLLAALTAARLAAASSGAAERPASAPIWIYDNWSAYDELSDSVPLSEALAMLELREMLRLRKAGVRLDYYLMDAFWYAPEGGYRAWRSESWPEGPERWLEACAANGIKPGLWFSSNTLAQMAPAPPWRSSLNASGTAMAFYAGGFLPDFMDALQHWYDRGIRLFKLDFADFTAAVPGDEKIRTPEEIRALNVAAFRAALRDFRRRNRDAILVAFNGFGGDMHSTALPLPFQDPVDPSWLDVFESLYSGDPRAADVPEMDFWRSVDIYSDHMVRRFEQSGIPLQRIDSTAFMVGSTGTNYIRMTNGWQGSLLLMIARGGRVNTVHGNLEFLDEQDARWFAKLQRLYAPMQEAGTTRSFGGIPGDAEPYGFASANAEGALYAVVNPSQRVAALRLPRPEPGSAAKSGARILFRDAGFDPGLAGDTVRLGPGQLALIGAGAYADAGHDLGTQQDILIPHLIELLAAPFISDATSLAIETLLAPPPTGDLRILMQQRDADGPIMRSVSTSNMGEIFRISAWQDGRPLPVDMRYDKVIWSGLSWAVGEIRREAIAPEKPIRIRLSSAETDASLRLEGRVYRIEYQEKADGAPSPPSALHLD